MQSRFCRRRRLERHVDHGRIGPCFFERGEFFAGLACPRNADLLVIFPGFGDEADRLCVADQLRGNADGAAGIQDMDGRAAIGGFDAQRCVGLGRGCAADQQRQLHFCPLHFFGNGYHFIQRGRDQPG